MNYNTRLFWLLNVSYWTLYYTIQGLTNPLFLGLSLESRLFVIPMFTFWIMLITATYRFVHKKFNFSNKSIPFLAIQISIGALIMTGLDWLCRSAVNDFFLGIFNVNPYQYGSDIFGRTVGVNTTSDTEMGIVFTQFAFNGQWLKFMAYIVWAAAYNFYHISLNMRRNAVEKIAIENRAKDLELINLRSQLNPHFLFNALNSIHSLAMTKKDTASDAVLLLSDLMRYTLNYEKRDLVALSEEMEVVEKYLQLEKIRFGEKLNTELAISDNTLAIKIPPIAVQTLVENAIKHGLKASQNGVFIKINSHLNGNLLTINIINSGQLKKEDPSVASIPRNDNEAKNSGIGVENTRRRLQMIYGEKASFDLKNLNENEVIATLSLPITN